MPNRPSDPSQSRVVTMNGRAYAWNADEGLDPAIALEVEGFIRKMAWGYAGWAKQVQLEPDDLIQEGWTGALRAAAKFNPDCGAQYLTYAAMWIDCAMKTALGRGLVRTPEGEVRAWVGSLDAPSGGDGGGACLSYLELRKDDRPGADELSAAAEDRARVRAALPKLNPRDREVLSRYAGLEGREAQPIKLIAEDLGVSRQRVQQILQKATKELRFQMAG